jgi:hypothetical protein
MGWGMLPFHKRARVNSSIEIASDDLEPIELPPVRPPSVRPGAFTPKASPRYDFSEDEMTVVRMDKRVSTSPPPRVELQVQRMPRPAQMPSFARYADDEPTQMHVSSSRPLLSMSAPPSSRVLVAHEVPPPPASHLRVDEPPRSAVAVDAASSADVRAVDLSMTSSLSGSTDLRNLRRPTMGWATALVALGVFAGIITAFVARGEGLATAAAFIDPSHAVTADVAKAVAAQPPQNPVAMAAGAAMPQPQAVTQKPAAPACNADAVAPVPAKVEAKVEAPKVEAKVEAKVVAAKVEKPEPKVVAHYVAPARHVEAVVREPAQVAVATPPPAITKPAGKAARHGGDDMESASAADALAKAQLDAALSR